LDELPVEVRTAIEAFELDERGCLKRVKFWPKLDALKFLGKTLELAAAKCGGAIADHHDIADAVGKEFERFSAASRLRISSAPG
jgi:hypothetical protein